jgi:hypothetical protein
MSLSHRNGIALTGLSAINGRATISAINGLAATLGGGGGGGSAPDSLPNLVAWFKPPIAGATNGVAVPSWPDSSGNGWNMTSGGFTPVYQTNQVNGYDDITAAGSRFLVSSADAGTYPITFFAGVKWDGSATGPSTIFGPNGTGGLQLRVEQTTGAVTMLSAATALVGTGGALTSGVWAAIVARATNATFKIWINGVAVASGSHSAALSAGRLFDMCRSNGGEGWFGDIVECGFFSDAKSDADAVNLSLYLSSKYAM